MFRSFQALVMKDHERIIALFASYRETLPHGPEKSLPVFRKFDRQLRRHIQIENEIFLPLFEDESVQHLANPTRSLRRDHDQFLELLERIERRLEQGILEGPEENLLHHRFLAHTFEEHNTICPFIDRHLPYGARRMAMGRIRRIEMVYRNTEPVSRGFGVQPHPAPH